MQKDNVDKVPQILAILPIKTNGKLRLVKTVKDYLGLHAGQGLNLDIKDEVLLETDTTGKPAIILNQSGTLILPDTVTQHLRITRPTLVGLVQRSNAVAVKVVEIEEVECEHARLVDIEMPIRIIRRVEMPLMPTDLIPKLQTQFAGLHLRYDVRPYIRGGSNLAMWKTRQMLNCPDSDDADLREKMVDERISAQEKDGSWSGSVLLTARNLRELAEMGVGRNHACVQRGAMWLLNQPQSTYNPGMFFATDDLVEEQAVVMAQRQAQKHGTRPRFRQIKVSEKKHVMSGDDLIYAPCGPRIMWPNGLALEALLALGYENHARVKTALETLTSQDWCECGYQNGSGEGAGRSPFTEEKIIAFEASCMTQYRYSGLRDIQALKQADAAHRTAALRVAELTEENTEADKKMYLLGKDDHIQGCEFITTRSLSQVKEPRTRRFAEAHLWRFASRQYADAGTFPSERYGTGFHQAGILQAVARYDHPVAKVIVLRALPWIVGNQKVDGSWGEDNRKDAETFSVVYALHSLGDHLPANIANVLKV